MVGSVFSKAGHFITVPLTDRCTNTMLTAAWTAVSIKSSSHGTSTARSLWTRAVSTQVHPLLR